MKEEKAELKKEHRIVKGKLARIEARRVKDSEAIIGDLDSILRTIDEHGDTAEGRREIAEMLSKDLVPREHKLRVALRQLRKQIKRIEAHDIGRLRELKNLPPAERKAAENEIREELRKLNVEDRIRWLAARIESYDRAFRASIAEAVNGINEGRMDAAREAILAARQREVQIRQLDDSIQKLRDRLRALTKREIKRVKAK